ncbi:MAG: DUF6464 family protein [Coleofasciculus sp. B1-GNL1-01]
MRQLSNTVDKKHTCRYYANSAFLLCAVNPLGSCEGCHEYEPEVTSDERLIQ